MVQKNLIACSVIVVSGLSSILLFSKGTGEKTIEKTDKTFNFLAPQKSENVKESTRTISTGFSFANEALPKNNAIVRSKIRHSIRNSRIDHQQSPELRQQAAKWFAIIEPILRQYGIPEDFKYIPLLESGLDNRVVSPRGAKGLWQFMPGTAREYGLHVSKDRDDRLNTRKATIAACRYIKELYSEFNSWTLAAAAYNAGSPRVQHAINSKNKGNYFYMALNRETGSYVYKLVALKQVYGQKPAPVKTKPKEVLAMLTPIEEIAYN